MEETAEDEEEGPAEADMEALSDEELLDDLGFADAFGDFDLED